MLDFYSACVECGRWVSASALSKPRICEGCQPWRESWWEYECGSCEKAVQTTEKTLRNQGLCAGCSAADRRGKGVVKASIGYWFSCRECGRRPRGTWPGPPHYELRERVRRQLCDEGDKGP